MTPNHRAKRLRILSLAAMAALTFVGITSVPAAADSLPAAGCVAACAATFDTPSAAETLAIPSGITSLTARVSGAAGAPASFAITNDATAVGGKGGATIVDLGSTYAGQTLTLGVGGTGQGSYIQSGSTLLAVAGGGGGGGYAGYLDLPAQILATYPGGDGGSPAGTGVTPGASGSAFGSLAANGGGGTTAAGVAGTGNANGTPGGATTTVTGAGSTLAGGSLLVGSTTHVGGTGGGGYTGGGGGAVERSVDNGDVPVDVVAPGGGGAGYLDAALTATSGTPNTGTGSVVVTWSFTPTISTTATTVHRGDTVPVTIAGLPANTAFTVVFDGTTVLTGTSDSTGAATESFTVGGGQSAGHFPLSLVVAGVSVATSDPVAVLVTLATTGGPNPELPGIVAILLILAGAATVLLVRRWPTREWALPGSNR